MERVQVRTRVKVKTKVTVLQRVIVVIVCLFHIFSVAIIVASLMTRPFAIANMYRLDRTTNSVVMVICLIGVAAPFMWRYKGGDSFSHASWIVDIELTFVGLIIGAFIGVVLIAAAH